MSSTTINNRANLENISPFRRDSSTVSNVNAQSQRMVGHSSHKKISSTSRGQLSHRCNSSSNASNNNNFANSSLNLHYNINTSLSQNNQNNSSNNTQGNIPTSSSSYNNENVLSSSLLRTSIANHSKQLSNGVGGNSFANSYSNINLCGLNQHSTSLSSSCYSKALTSTDNGGIGGETSSKNSHNVSSISIAHMNKMHQQQQQQQQQQPSLSQLKQNAIKKYCLQQQQNFQQQGTSASSNLYGNQVPPYHFEKGVSKTHRGHTSSYNNFSYIQQQQNSSVSNILGNSQKPNLSNHNGSHNGNWNQATPPNKRMNTMPSSGNQQPQQQSINISTNTNQVNDENAVLGLSSSINISTYKVSPRLLKSSSNTNQNSLGQTNAFQQNTQSNNTNSNNNNNVSCSSNSNQVQQNQTSTSSNHSGSNNQNTYANNSNNQNSLQQGLSIKRVYSQEEQSTYQVADEEDQVYLEKLKKEIEGYKQREVQYLTRINSLEGDNKTINDSVIKQETNIKTLKHELVKYQQQSQNTQMSNNSNNNHETPQSQQQQMQQQASNNSNINVQLQQKQIAMLESYVETLSKKLQQLEMEQIRQSNSNPQIMLEKQYIMQKNKYKQLVEKYFTLEKLFNQITSENDYYKITLDQLKSDLEMKNQQNQSMQQQHQSSQQNEQVQSSVLKALQLVQATKQQ